MVNMTLFQIPSCLSAPQGVSSSTGLEDFTNQEYCGISLYPCTLVILEVAVDKGERMGSWHHSSFPLLSVSSHRWHKGAGGGSVLSVDLEKGSLEIPSS